MGENVSLIDGHIDGSDRCVICGRDIPEGSQYCVICGKVPSKVQTNYDRIRNMTVEEMADYFNGIFDCSNCPNDMFLCAGKGNVCTKYIKQWLESEVSE